MIGDKFKNMIKMAFFLSLLLTLFLPNISWSYNKSWDQGHLVCVNEPGTSNWGKFDKGGVFHGGYSSKECCELFCKVCPVYANTGQLQKTFTDLTVPGVGPALHITRTYNSQDWMTSLLGYGWTFNFGRHLIIGRNENGEKIVGILLDKGEKNFYKENPDGTLERLTGYGPTYDLVKNADNTYIIKNRDGSRYELREDGKIAKIIDQNGNTLNFTYKTVGCIDRVTNASGNYVDFILGPNGKIASVLDNLGRTITYVYDNNGNLISVTDLLGNITRYVYNSNNLLVQIIDARGNTVESLTYDNNQPPRVATFTEKGETYTITYYSDRTTKRDSKGNTWTYYFNDVGVITKVIDPLGNVKEQALNKITATSMDWEEDLNGNRTTYTYDANGNMTSKTYPLGNTTTYTYIFGTNLIQTETNPLGVVTKYEYDNDTNGNQTRIIRDFGGSLQNTTTYTYDSRGNQTSVTNPLGNTTYYQYDANGNLIRVTDPLGNATIYTYDTRGNKLTETNALGNTTTYAYDLMNRLTSVTDALGGTTSYSYDANGNKTSMTDVNGNTRTYTYDAYNRLIRETDPLGNSTSYTYDSRDNRTSMADPNGNITQYAYDILNRLTRETNALGGQTNYTYDSQGNRLAVTDANGNITTYTYDGNNRQISQTDVAGEIVSYNYDAKGNLITQSISNGNTITRTYDTLNRLVKIADTLGTVRSYTYNLAGLKLTESDALGNTTSYYYDANNRCVQQTDPLGNSTVYTYDAIGNLLTVTDREGHSISYSYDALRRRISTTDSLGNITDFAYDKIGNISSITDANGHVTAYDYDKVNRLIQETYADGTIRNFTYDPVGNRLARTDQKGQVTAYVYDKLNRRVKIDYPGINDNEYSYDGIGNLLAANNQNVTNSFTYDNAYRITQTNQNGEMVGYSYDVLNNIRTITYPGGKVVKEVRNRRNLLTRIENTSSQVVVQYAYDNANRLQTKNYLNGITASFTHNTNGWITDLTYNDGGGSQIIGFQYGFDNEGHRLYANKSNDPSNSEQYSYDVKNRLMEFKRGALYSTGNIVSPVTKTVYNLDALGNWKNKNTDGIVENRIHNEMNEISDIDGTLHTYDNNGNLVDDGINTYEHDYENLLIKVIRKSDSTILGEYKYDALGRRIAKQTLGISTSYYYDSFRVIEEQIGGLTEATYVYGNEIDEVIAMERSGQVYYYHANSLGSIIALTDTLGNIVERYLYDVYGKPNIVSSSVGNPYLFTGRRWDEEIGLYDYRVRHYSQKLGRFLQRDPLGYIDDMNLYEYVANDPVNSADAFGLTSIGSILQSFFWPWDTGEKLWVMGESDPYTRIVRAWAPVQGNMARLKQAVASDPRDWDQNHRTSPGWAPTMSYSPDPNNGWNVLEASPPGTDPETARRNFIIFVLTGYATDELHTSAIGSFHIIATADDVDIFGCRVKLNIWMYNEMSRRSFGRFADHPLFRWRPMRSQFMWWNWKEEFSFDSQGRVTDIPSNSGGGW